MISSFGEFHFDEERFELRGPRGVVSLPALAMDTLALLVKNRGKLVAVDQLIAGPWRGQVVSHSAIRQVVVTLRRALGDDPASPKLIQTVRGKGFRLASDSSEAPADSLMPPSSSSAGAARTSIFVGRAAELEALRAAANATAAGRGQLWFFTGAQGIGKSTLIDRLGRELEATGVDVLRGRCWEGGGAPALWPWPEIVRAWKSLHGAAAITDLAADRLSDLARLLPELDPKPGRAWSDVDLDESAQIRFRVFDSLKTFLQRAGEQRPLLVVVEDVHCADDAALLLLEFLARSIAESRVLVIASCRPLEASRRPQLEAALRGTYPSVVTLPLSGLDGPALSDWLRSTPLGQSAPALVEQAAKVLHEITEGHPLLVQEAIRRSSSLQNLSELRHALSGGVELPARVIAAVRERVGPLPAATNQVLEDAALLGREFRLSDLPPVDARNKQGMLELLTPALSAHVIETPALGRLRFRFSHDLVREAFLVGMPLERRALRHAEIARHLDARVQGEQDELLFQVAQHALAGHSSLPLNEVLDTLLGAAECAQSKLAYELAEGFCNDGIALARVESCDPARRAELLLGLAITHTLQGRTQEADADYLRCVEYAWDRELFELLGRAVVSWFRLLGETAAVHQGFQAWVERATERAPDPSGLRARLTCALTVARYAVMPAARCRELLLAAHAMVENDPPGLVAFVAELCRHQLHLGDPSGTLAAADAALDHVRRGRVNASMHRLRVVRMGCLVELGRGAELLADMAAHSADCARLPYPDHAVERRADAFDPVRGMLSGDVKGAEIAARRIREVRSQSLAGTSLLAAQTLALGLESNEADCVRLLNESMACAEIVLGVVANYVPLLACTALCRAKLGQTEAARAILDRLAEVGLEHVPDDRLRPACLSLLGWSAALVGHQRLVPAVLAALEPYAGLHLAVQLEAYLGPVSFYLGELSLAHGDREGAVRWYKQALSEAELICSRPWSARARRQLAVLEAT